MSPLRFATPRSGPPIPASVGSTLGIALGVAALIFAGSVLGKGLTPSGASGDMVAVEGSGVPTAGDGLAGAFSSALRVLGVVPPEAAAPAKSDVVMAVLLEPAVEFEVESAALVEMEEEAPAPPPSSDPIVTELSLAVVQPSPPAVAPAVELAEALAFEPLMPDDDVEPAEEEASGPATEKPPAVVAPAAEPQPPRPDPPRAPAPPVLVPPAGFVQPTPRPTRPPAAPIPPPPATAVPSKTPRPPATAQPSVTPQPTATRAPTRTAVPTAKPQVALESGEGSRN